MIENDSFQGIVSESIGAPLPHPLNEQIERQIVISVVVPTRNEAGNIKPLLTQIDQATRGIPSEVVFVDDSTDETPQTIRDLHPTAPLPIVLIARPPELRRNGLGGAVVEGLRIARAPWVCVMDSDLQHPPELIPQLLKHAEETKADIVIGSRLAPGGDARSLGSKRTLISRTFAMTTRLAFPVRLRHITDPLSGFFLVRREAVNLECLHPDGFKILLEILIRCPELRISEIPFQFGYRHAGESKASLRETIRFFRRLFHLRLAGDQLLIRFLAVRASGLVVNSLSLLAFTELAGLHYLLSAAVATQVSTLWNFGLTESWVFGGRKTGHSLPQRFGSFLLMNNLMLLLRGPLLAFMVAQWGMHYVLSNLVSLLTLTLLRYLAADRWIWTEVLGSKSPDKQNKSLSPVIRLDTDSTRRP